MNKTEEITRNIGLAFDLLDAIIANPALADAIPTGAAVRFVRADSMEQSPNVPFVVRSPQMFRKGYDFTVSKVG